MENFIVKNGSLVTYQGSGGKVVIPNNVRIIGSCVFQDRTDLTEVEIPESVTEILEKAFYGCTNLNIVHIPDSVEMIGRFAFMKCSFLKNISLPQGINIHEKAFSVNTNISYHEKKPVIEEIPDTDADFVMHENTLNAYFGRNTSVNIPENITIIGEYAFSKCIQLETADLPEHVQEIRAYAFAACTELSQVIIPDSVTSIQEYAFFRCPALKSVTIPDSVKTLGDDAFRDCTGLAEITLPQSIKLGNDIFLNCPALKHIKIRFPGGVVGTFGADALSMFAKLEEKTSKESD